MKYVMWVGNSQERWLMAKVVFEKNDYKFYVLDNLQDLEFVLMDINPEMVIWDGKEFKPDAIACLKQFQGSVYYIGNSPIESELTTNFIANPISFDTFDAMLRNRV